MKRQLFGNKRKQKSLKMIDKILENAQVGVLCCQLDYASQCTNCSKNSLKSPATLDLGASSSVSGTSKHLSTQTVPLGQSLGYSPREEWKIIQHG